MSIPTSVNILLLCEKFAWLGSCINFRRVICSLLLLRWYLDKVVLLCLQSYFKMLAGVGVALTSINI